MAEFMVMRKVDRKDPGVLAERFDMKIGLLRPIRPQVLRPNLSPKRSDMVFVGKFVLDLYRTSLPTIIVHITNTTLKHSSSVHII